MVRKQLELLRFRAECGAFGFDAILTVLPAEPHVLKSRWEKDGSQATLDDRFGHGAKKRRYDDLAHLAGTWSDEDVAVLAELRVGFKAGSREKINLLELEDFLASPRVSVPAMSEQTARFYAETFTGLKEKGKPIPLNDVWIAACTLEAGAILISYDAHFTAHDCHGEIPCSRSFR